MSFHARIPHPHAALFVDRRDAGRRLGRALRSLAGPDVVVVGLPRGGVPVAAEVARALDAPLDVIIVRKIGAPMRRELGIGALGEDGVVLVDRGAIEALGVSREQLEAIIEEERRELARRQVRYRRGRPALPLEGRTVVVVDDGIATGGTAIAAARIARARGADRIVLAVPVAPPATRQRLAGHVDEFVCLESPDEFFSVGQAYERFTPTGDDEVVALLTEEQPAGSAVDPPAAAPGTRRADALDWSSVRRERVQVPADGAMLEGDLRVPPAARGCVLFAHGSGSSRHSPRNVEVAGTLNGAGFATLLFDLLTPGEAQDRARVFDIPSLVQRLVAATDWTTARPGLERLSLGYFGASTGAAAALGAAAVRPGRVAAVVSRGGRPDLAEPWLARVAAPTLLIVGGRDELVLDANLRARQQMTCPCELAIVPGATHLFEEPTAMEQVAALAGRWFDRHLHAPGADG